MNREAIERLIKILLDVEPEKFCIDRLYGGFKGRRPTLELLNNECGTIACAAGYASLDPWFQKNAVSIDFDDAEILLTDNMPLLEILNIDMIIFELIFGYRNSNSILLFYEVEDLGMITPKMVAAKLQKILDAES